MVSAAQNQLIQATLTPAALGAQISSAVAANVLNSARQQGAAVVQLLDDAAIPANSAVPTLPHFRHHARHYRLEPLPDSILCHITFPALLQCPPDSAILLDSLSGRPKAF